VRIFYAVYPSPNAWSLPHSTLWDSNLLWAMQDLGHEVIRFDYDLSAHFRNLDQTDPRQRAFIVARRPSLEQALLGQIAEEHRRKPIDLFFSYFYSACVTPATIQAIRNMGIVTVNWYCNAVHQFHLISDIAPAYDYCLVPERFRLDDYRRIGAHPVYCQEAANPMVYQPRTIERDLDVVFVGQRYGERARYIARLAAAGVSVKVWGPGWLTPRDPRSGRQRLLARVSLLRSAEGRQIALKRLRSRRRRMSPEIAIPREVVGPQISDNELALIYSRGKIALGLSAVGDVDQDGERQMQVRARDFEAPMSGVFYLVEYMPELEDFFEIGREIVCYHDLDDLVDRAAYYLAHDQERERIRKAGYRRAVNDHTWQKRLAQAFAQMGLQAPA
jgi:spore maturation protein CgeB